VESLVLIRLQAPVAGCLAVRVIQVFDRPTGDKMEFVGDSTKISRSSQAGINEGQGEHVVASAQVGVGPWSFQLEVDFISP